MATKGGKRPGAGRKPKGDKAAPPVVVDAPKPSKVKGVFTCTPGLVAEICDRLSEGETLSQICRDEHMPCRSTVYLWMDSDQEVAGHIARAREKGFDAIAEECLAIANTPVIGQKSVSKATGLEITQGDMIEHRRLQVETRLKLLAKWDPKRYGDKQQVEHSGSIDVAAILSARKRSNGQAES